MLIINKNPQDDERFREELIKKVPASLLEKLDKIIHTKYVMDRE